MIEHPLPVGRRLALLDQFLSTAQSSTRIASGVVSQDRRHVASELAERTGHQLIERLIGPLPVLPRVKRHCGNACFGEPQEKRTIASLEPPRKCIHRARRPPALVVSGRAKITGISATRAASTLGGLIGCGLVPSIRSRFKCTTLVAELIGVSDHRFAAIQRADLAHLFLGQLEVEDVDVLGHPT